MQDGIGGLANSLSEFFKNQPIFLSVCISVLIFAGLVWFLLIARKTKWQTSTITEIAIACALSLVLGFFPIVRMPEGGTISLAMLPIVILSLRKGVVAGILCGAISGLLQYFADPFFVHPLQFLIDYPFAWGMVGLAGLAREKVNTLGIKITVWSLVIIILAMFVFGLIYDPGKWDQPVFMLLAVCFLVPGFLIGTKNIGNELGSITLGVFGRFSMHFISGIVYFAQYIWPGYSLFGYVAIYISIHLVPEMILSFLITVPLFNTEIFKLGKSKNL